MAGRMTAVRVPVYTPSKDRIPVDTHTRGDKIVNSDPNAYLTIACVAGPPDDLLAAYERTAPIMAGVGRDHGLILHAGAKAGDGFRDGQPLVVEDGSEAAARDPRRLGVLKELAISPDRFQREHFEVVDFNLFAR